MSAVTRRQLGERERFVAFAFAGADLLVETDLNGRIGFTAGAFRLRLGAAPENFIGQDVAGLIACPDRECFAASLSLMPERGRMTPTVLRLANPEQTPFVISGLHLALPGEAPRLCISMDPVPIPQDPSVPAAPSRAALLREAEARLRMPGRAGGQLGLIEVTGQLSPELRAALTQQAGNLAAELSQGRYGLLSARGETAPDIAAVTTRLEAILALHGGVAEGGGSGEMLALDAHGLSPVQAVRALRHGLATFTRAGSQGMQEGGFGEGLSGFVQHMTQRAGTIRRAIAQRRFHLEYQPIISLADGALHHYEALLRPEKGLLGAAAFRYLKAFRVDYVKVDGSFVEAAMRGERDRSFVAAMVDLWVAVGAKVVAEQIETAEYVKTMQALGVHLGRGWHFGRPGPLPKAAPIIAAKRGGKQESWG